MSHRPSSLVLLRPLLRPPHSQARAARPSHGILASLPRQQHLMLRRSSRHLSTAASSPPPSRRTSRTVVQLTSALLLLTTGYGLALAFPPLEVLPRFFLFKPPPSPKSPPSSSSPSSPVPIPRLPEVLTPSSTAAYTQALEEAVQSLPAVIELRRTLPRVGRPYISIPLEKRLGSFLGTTLRKPGCIAIPPLVFSNMDNTSCISVIHLGPSLCGHESVIHGGLLASLMDESLARPAILNLPSSVGVTATLDMQYLKPTMADQFVVLRTKVERKEGRKVWVSGVMLDLEGRELVKAKALFVEPRNAWVLGKHAKERVRRIFGEEAWTGAPREGQSDAAGVIAGRAGSAV